MLLTSLATYTNLAPPMSPNKAINPKSSSSQQSSIKSKFGFIPNRDSIKLNPCEIVLDTFQTYLNTLEMEQVSRRYNYRHLFKPFIIVHLVDFCCTWCMYKIIN